MHLDPDLVFNAKYKEKYLANFPLTNCTRRPFSIQTKVYDEENDNNGPSPRRGMTLLLPMQVLLMIVCPLFVNKLTQPTPSSHFANIYISNFPPSRLREKSSSHMGKESWSDHLGCGEGGTIVATQTNANEMQMSQR